MNLLYSNDRPGEYPKSWYAATAEPPGPFAPLDGDGQADVCIVGGGYTGLSAALHLAEQGVNVTLLEAHRVGFGASGRNGGQLGSGQRKDQLEIEAAHGIEAAQRFWELGEEAKALVRDLVARHDIDCDLRPGIAWLGFGAAEMDELHDYADHMSTAYGYDHIAPLSRDEGFAICPSPAYHGGLIDRGAGHLHPLRLAFGLARAAARAGARICEMTEVLEVTDGDKPSVRTVRGTLRADHIILACNGYLGSLHRKTAARVMPINNFVVATEPLGALEDQVLTEDIAVADTKFVVNYFRKSADGRLLFGGGESYGFRFPADIAAKVRAPMTRIFPKLADIGIDYAWGGTLAITLSRLPYLGRVGKNVLSSSGYSGHGVGTATHAGKLLAEAVRGQSDGFDAFAALPTTPFPGGSALRAPLLALGMTWYALRDRIGR